MDSLVPLKGTLIKGSLPYIYYLASDGKRYVFPTHYELVSWYGPFKATAFGPLPLPDDATVCQSVSQFADETLADISIGGNVTVRPGVYVVGISTDASRWAVSKGVVLHKFASDAAKTAVYGSTYSARELLRPDAIFVNYAIGADLELGGAYDPVAESGYSLEDTLGIVK